MISICQRENELNGKRVLVTGANGFIGSHLVESLVHAGADVLGVDREHKLESKNDCSAPLQLLDLANVQETVAVFEDFRPQYVYHLASAADGAEDFAQVRRSIDGGIVLTVNLLEAFRLFPGDLFVFGDSSKVYGDPGVAYRESLPEAPLSSYAIAKSAAWQFCKYHRRIYGTNVVSVRPTLVYGPGQPKNLIAYVVDAIMTGHSEIRLMGGQQTRDPLYCGDLLNAYMALPEFADRVSGRIINLGGGREISVFELVQLIVRLLDSDIRIQVDPSNLRPTESMRSFCSNDDAFRLLGWKPEVDLESGLKDVIFNYVDSSRAISN